MRSGRRGAEAACSFVVLSLLFEGVRVLLADRMAGPAAPGRRSGRCRPICRLRATALIVPRPFGSSCGLSVSFTDHPADSVAARRCRVGPAPGVADRRRSRGRPIPEPPVLFLRIVRRRASPADRGDRVPWFLRVIRSRQRYKTLEEMIVAHPHLRRPGRRGCRSSRAETPVGAARWRLRDDEWQRVRRAADSSRQPDCDWPRRRPAGLRWRSRRSVGSPGALRQNDLHLPSGAGRRAPRPRRPCRSALDCDNAPLRWPARDRIALMATRDRRRKAGRLRRRPRSPSWRITSRCDRARFSSAH